MKTPMLKQGMLAVAAGASLVAVTVPTAAEARHHHYRTYGTTRVYRGPGGRYYCRRGDGTAGTIIGAGAGALVGAALTHGAAGPIIGAVGGGLLGRHIGRHTVHCR